MRNILEQKIYYQNYARIISLISCFLQNRIEYYSSIHIMEHLANNDDYNLAKTKHVIRQELEYYLIKFFKRNFHLFTLNDASEIFCIAEYISLKFEPIIKENLEKSLHNALKYQHQISISESIM